MERGMRFGLLAAIMTIQTAAFADIQGAPTLSAGQELNISSGVVGVSGGDLQWTGTQINFLGNAKAFILNGNQTSSFPNFTLTQAQGDASAMNQTSVTSPTVGTAFLMQANSGTFGKVLITAQSGSSVTLQYDAFSPAASGPITYTMTGTMQGGVNNGPFNGNFTWLVIADTSGITNPSNGMYQNSAIRSYLTISGVGNLIPLQSTTVTLNTTASTVTFNGGGASVTVPVAGSSFPSNLATVIGYFVGSGPATFTPGNINTNGNQGGININNVSGGNAPKFQATNAPTIESISNGASNAVPGTTTAQLAQGSIFVIKGNALGPSTLFAAPSAQIFQSTTVDNTSVTVTVGQTTVNALMYYTSAGQVAALLPSNTPLGSGAFTVIYNGVASASMNHTIVASNLGLFTLDSTGQGPGIVTYPDYSYVSAAKASNCTGPSNTGVEAFVACGAANPGDTLILWATGLGPLPSGVADNSPGGVGVALNSVQLTLWLGGVSVPIVYQGRGCCIGEDQIVFTLPTTGTLVPTGCAVPLVAQINLGTSTVISNTVSIAVASGSRNCTATDPVQASQNLQQTVLTGAPFGVATSSLSRNPGGPNNTVEDDAKFTFQKVLAVNTAFAPFFEEFLDDPPLGTCVVYDNLNANNNIPITNIANADAGKSVTITGPTNSLLEALQPGKTSVVLSTNAAFLNPGTFTISGGGGADIGPFKGAINIPGALTLISPTQATLTTGVSRANGLPVTWSGGAANGVAVIVLQSPSDISYTNGSTVNCLVSATAGSFTIPPYVLEALNPGAAVLLSIEQDAFPTPVTGTGIGFGEVSFSGLGTNLQVNLQ